MLRDSLRFLTLLLCLDLMLARNLQVVPATPLSSASLTKIPVVKSQLDPSNYTAYKLPNDLNFMVVIDPNIQTSMLTAWSVQAGEIDASR